MAVNIKLEAFEGPMDLLYALIIKNKIDIYDIPIVEITEQYLECIEQIKKENMSSVTEFIVMAATLIEIKSKMLLPRITPAEEEEEDPREELVRKLVEYKKIKILAGGFDKRQAQAGTSYYKGEDKSILAAVKDTREKDPEEILKGADMDMLYKAFKEVLRRRQLKTDKVRSGFGKIEPEHFTIEEKTAFILNKIALLGEVNFFSLFEENSVKEEIIATFLAMLELIRKGRILIYQEDKFHDIAIRGREAA